MAGSSTTGVACRISWLRSSAESTMSLFSEASPTEEGIVTDTRTGMSVLSLAALSVWILE